MLQVQPSPGNRSSVLPAPALPAQASQPRPVSSSEKLTIIEGCKQLKAHNVQDLYRFAMLVQNNCQHLILTQEDGELEVDFDQLDHHSYKRMQSFLNERLEKVPRL